MPPQFEVQKVFFQRGYLCLYRLVKCTAFTCNRCGLEKTSKLIAFAKNKRDEPVCNGCYGHILSVNSKPHTTIDCLDANGNKVVRARITKDPVKQQVRILKRPTLSFIGYLTKFQKNQEQWPATK